MDQNELPQGKRTGSSAWSSPTCVRFGRTNVQTPPNSDRNCTFPWWMDTPIWSRPAGAISTKAVTLKPLWKIIFGNSAAIPAPFWRTGSTRPAGIKCSVPSSASGCPVRRRAAGKPLRQTPKSSARSIGMPVIATPLRDETAKTEAALIILAMNASLRLARRLALFFRSLLSLFLYVVFSAGPMIGVRR